MNKISFGGIVSALVMGLCVPALAEIQQYRATINGIRYEVEAPIYYADEVAYVSLASVAEALSGRVEITSESQGEVRLAGGRAVVTFNSAEVSVGLRSFTLDRPALRYEDQILVPLAETARFFDEAFAVNLLPLRAADLDDPALDAEIAAENQAPGSAAIIQGIDTVVIDPGHGGSDPGTVGPSGTTEKDLALKVGLALRNALKESTSLKVYMTREEDKNLTLAERVNLVNQHPNALIISIHAGASFSESAHGVEFFSAVAGRGDRSEAATRSRMAAQALAEDVVKRTEAKLRGVHQAPLRLLGASSTPGVHVEIGCLTNSAQEDLLNTEAYQRLVATGLSEGVRRVTMGASA